MLPRHITWIVQTSDMGRHKLHRAHHSRDGGPILHMVIHEFDPSLRVGWQGILSWFLVEWDRLMESFIG